MFGHSYYHGILRKYVIMFGNMFNDIDVVRYNNAGTAVQTIRVPIAYGPREKFLTRLRADPNLDREVAIQLPRLSFEMTGVNYAPERGLNKLQRNVGIRVGNNNALSSVWTPTPYDISFTLHGMFANQEDAVQVVEQILPFFRPEWTHTLTLVPEVGDKYDIPTVLNDMQIDDTYEADFMTRRAILYSFNFAVKGYLFGPTTNKGVIKRAIIDLSANSVVGVPNNVRLDINPGLLANGSPTTNATASIATTSISANSDYGYTFEKFDYFDGVNRHGHGE
tara:strand:+ start:3046 stop:3882 length:837 start_codon:yes stop_codon:yes gene_type:complete